MIKFDSIETKKFDSNPFSAICASAQQFSIIQKEQQQTAFNIQTLEEKERIE